MIFIKYVYNFYNSLYHLFVSFLYPGVITTVCLQNDETDVFTPNIFITMCLILIIPYHMELQSMFFFYSY